MKLSVNEIFKSIQGEGVYTGYPSVFIRLNGCNLRCAFKNGSICDTAYTSWDPEKCPGKEVDEVFDEVMKLLDNNCTHIVFTGGEPLLQQKGMIELIEKIDKHYENDEDHIVYTIETNGSIDVDDKLYELIDLFSISPKLDNSACFEGTNISKSLQDQHNKQRINYKNIYNICINACYTQLKFVYSDDNTEKDIDNFFDGLHNYCKSIDDKELFEYNHFGDGLEEILIMPEGSNEEEMKQSAQKAVDVCIRRGWRYCHRVHISIWGNKRAV